MLKATIDFLLKVLPILSPWLLPFIFQFSFVDHIPGVIHGRHEFEPAAKAALTLAAFAIAYLVEILGRAQSYWETRAFGARYVNDIVFKSFEDTVKKDGLVVGKDVRVNVMFTRGVWWLLFLPWVGRGFTWFVYHGFTPPTHGDRGLVMLTWQGLCGRAYQDEKPKVIDLQGVDVMAGPWYERWLFLNQFRMAPWQLKRTKDVAAILSVPIFRQVKPAPAAVHEIKGVVNVDATSRAGAAWILKNQAELTKFFDEHGTVLAELA